MSNVSPSHTLSLISLFASSFLPPNQLPQVAQYLSSQKYDAHFDAFDVTTVNGKAFCANGGQRIATVLIYLNDVSEGGRTNFPLANWRADIEAGTYNPLDGGSFPKGSRGVSVKPKRGACVVFFPSYNLYDSSGNKVGVQLDPLALHQAEPAVDIKYVSQIWVREGAYAGVPSVRLASPIN